jgi:hypothetical protein
MMVNIAPCAYAALPIAKTMAIRDAIMSKEILFLVNIIFSIL